MDASRLIFPTTARVPSRLPSIRLLRPVSRLLGRLVRAETLSVPAAPAEVATVRERLRVVLRAAHPCADAAELVVSELVTNAIVHGSEEGALVHVRIQRLPRSGVVLAVTDSGNGTGSVPRLQMATAAGTRGRGLFIVGSLARQWSIRRVGTGHRIRVVLAPSRNKEPEEQPRLGDDLLISAFLDVGEEGSGGAEDAEGRVVEGAARPPAR